MSEKTISIGARVKSFLILAVVLAMGLAVLQWLDSGPNGRRSSREVVKMDVTFIPELREKVVTVSVAVNGSEIHRDATKLSPWQWMTEVPRGSVVSLLATQGEGSELWCTMWRTGVPPVVRGPASGDATVRCMT